MEFKKIKPNDIEDDDIFKDPYPKKKSRRGNDDDEVDDTHSSSFSKDIKKGMTSGMRKGIGKGAENVFKDYSQEVAEKTMANMFGGQQGTPYRETDFDKLMNMAKFKMMEKMMGINDDGPRQAQVPPQQQQINPIGAIISELKHSGLPEGQVQKVLEKLTEDPEKLMMSSLNPAMAPFLLFMKDKKQESGNDDRLMNVLMMMMMMNQNSQQGNQQQSSSLLNDFKMLQLIQQGNRQQPSQDNRALSAIYQLVQQLANDNREMQREIADSKLKQLEERLQGQPHPLQWINDLAEQWEVVRKLTGQASGSGARSEAEINLELEKMRMDREWKEKQLDTQKEILIEQQSTAKMQALANVVEGAMHKLGKGIGSALVPNVDLENEVSQIPGGDQNLFSQPQSFTNEDSPGVTVTPGINTPPPEMNPFSGFGSDNSEDYSSHSKFAKKELLL